MRVFATNKISIEPKQPNMLARKSGFGCFRLSKSSVKKVVTTGNNKQMRFSKLPCSKFRPSAIDQFGSKATAGSFVFRPMHLRRKQQQSRSAHRYHSNCAIWH